MQTLFTEVLSDNYVWMLVNSKKEAIILDCGDFKKVNNFLKEHSIKAKYILVTHAHDDHIVGIDELRKETGALVVGNKHYKDRLPELDIEVEGGDSLDLLETECNVIYTPGHCLDHLSFHFPQEKALFCGDFIFSLGCGRIFEGTPNDMLSSFDKIRELPADTLVYPSHEYTKSNLHFVKSLGFFNLAERETEIMQKEVTLPTRLGFEIECNPFLNVNNVTFKEAIMGTSSVDNVTFFQHLRELKNNITKLTGG